MAITNEQAMKNLQSAKALAAQSGFDNGVFLGACGAYLQAEVITLAQYMQLTGIESVPA